MYFCSDSVRTSARNPVSAVEVMPVRRRLMKAVFFFRDESRELLTSRTSGFQINSRSKVCFGMFTFVPRPCTGIEIVKLTCEV